MKNKIIILLFICLINSMFYSESISPDELPFLIDIPDFAVKYHDIRVMGTKSERQLKSEMVKKFESENMYVYRIEAFNISSIIDDFPDRVFNPDFESLIRSNSVSDSVIYSYLETPGKYKTFSAEYGSQYFEYEKFTLDGNTIGEIIFRYSKENSFYPSDFDFEIIFIKNEKLYRLFYSFNDPLYKIPVANPSFFEERQGYWYTKSFEYDFYNEISEGVLKNIPEYSKYFCGWNLIFDSIKVGLGQSSSKQNNFSYGILNNYRVRIRTQPNLNGEQIGYLDKNQKVRILDHTEEPMQIGEMNSVWYKIRTEDGLEGWAYGHFIDLQ
ncbi:SH3 domain-containing protein [Spirochaeta isovalerica]|uniref:SH3b domain-containing protein n=1 Tax=Spirochaeta isovalerica TaxID=150 RepID=A0A841RDF2_9SPIO|nr:SH3 domain-containing protein [Spirochaeta isovalerica]MBB6480879.1 hypothetical protein [Spirochaeta isovalerica]